MVRVQLSGYAPAIAHELEHQHEQARVTPQLPASPGKLQLDYFNAELKVAVDLHLGEC